MGIVMEFAGSYGLWVVLGAVFVAMHWFGKNCCGSGRDRGTTLGARRLPQSHPSDRIPTAELKESRDLVSHANAQFPKRATTGAEGAGAKTL